MIQPPSTSPQAAELAAWLSRQLTPGASLTGNSRMVSAGDGFLAYPGMASDGRLYIADAIARGAGAVLWQSGEWSPTVAAKTAAAPAHPATASGHAPEQVHPSVDFQWQLGSQIAQRGVADLRALGGPIAAAYYGHPSHHLDLIAITGTNGKTSCSHWIAQGLEAAGKRSGIIGTLGSGRVGRLDPFGLTTPDAVSLQGMLAGFVAEGVSAVAMEASSIGLDQGRLSGARVAAAVFTNLTHDHLDYHGSMAKYATAKARLFATPGLRVAVVNGDDQAAALMLAAVESVAGPGPARIGYRIDAAAAGGSVASRTSAVVDGWLLAEHLINRPDGLTVEIGGDYGRASVPLRVLGRFNVSNMMAVAATWIGLGMSFDEAMNRLAMLDPVRGRLETVDVGAAAATPLVVVDYAHTPDALVNVLTTLREVADTRQGRLWCVFGAGGDRDPSKRPLMGQAAERLADHVVVTSDNPRNESPLRIVADIRAGLSREPQLTELDRGNAIGHTIADASAADVVLIAGKGHEDYQEVGGKRLPFSDVDQARIALIRWREAAHV